MLNKQAIYRKTPKGVEAIAHRQLDLALKLRPLLIMVDGKRNFSELAALATVVGDCEQLVSLLVQDGLIEPVSAVLPVGAEPAAPAALVPATAPAAPAALVVASLLEAKRVSSHLLNDLLGPTAEELCMKIESADNLAEFVRAVKRARDVVRDIRGGSAADRFIAQVELHTQQA